MYYFQLLLRHICCFQLYDLCVQKAFFFIDFLFFRIVQHFTLHVFWVFALYNGNFSNIVHKYNIFTSSLSLILFAVFTQFKLLSLPLYLVLLLLSIFFVNFFLNWGSSVFFSYHWDRESKWHKERMITSLCILSSFMVATWFVMFWYLFEIPPFFWEVIFWGPAGFFRFYSF